MAKRLCTLGYDWGVSNNAAALPSFQKQYGREFHGSDTGYIIPARYLSGWSAAASGGDIIGILLSGQLIEWIGRKHSLLVGAVITAIGVGMQVASTEWILFLCGRLVNALGFGIVYILSPVWIGETVRPELRGFYLCLMNTSIVVGQLLLAVVSRAISTIQGDWSYRSLILTQFIFCVLLLILYPWFPESPYYLLKRGRKENARKALNRIYGSSDQALIDAEMDRIANDVAFSESLRAAATKNGSAIIQCFRSSNLRRTLIACLPVAEQQCIGSTFVFGFMTYFLSLIGINDFFSVTVALSCVMLVSSAAAFPLIEVFGRRKLLIPGTYSLTAALLVMGVTGCFDSRATVWVFLVSIFLWAVVYQSTLGAIGFAFGAEVPSLPLRSSTVSLMGFVQMVGVWVLSLVLPYLINPDAANLGAKIGFIFFGLSIVPCILMWFFIPETKGLSFKEMDYLFATKTDCRRFQDTVQEYRSRAGADIDATNIKGILADGVEIAHIERSV
ncbi:general substrate transporter [Lipomyces starkeyi]